MTSNATLDLLAVMGEEWSQQTAALVDLAVATVIRRDGLNIATFSAQDLADTLAEYDIRREVTSTKTETLWTIRLVHRDVPLQGKLSLHPEDKS